MAAAFAEEAPEWPRYGNFLEASAATKASTAARSQNLQLPICRENLQTQVSENGSRGHGKEGVVGFESDRGLCRIGFVSGVSREVDDRGSTRLAGITVDGRPILVVVAAHDPDFVSPSFLEP